MIPAAEQPSPTQKCSQLNCITNLTGLTDLTDLTDHPEIAAPDKRKIPPFYSARLARYASTEVPPSTDGSVRSCAISAGGS